MMTAWNWMASNSGMAAATWVSDILSLLAIVLAVGVALVELRRAKADQLHEAAQQRLAIEREEQRRADTHARAISAALSMMDSALATMREDLPSVGAQYISWTTRQGKPLELRSIKQSLESLRIAVLEDVDLLMDLSTAATILDGAISPPGMQPSPPVTFVLGALKDQSAALEEVRDRVASRC